MSDYIKNQNTVGGLVSWTVCLINVSVDGKAGFEIADFTDASLGVIGAGIKRDSAQYTDGGNACDLHTLTSKDHEYFDYSTNQMEAVEKYKDEGKEATEIRTLTREREKGLLILYPIGDVEPLTRVDVKKDYKTPFGFAIVFPNRQGKGDIKSYHINDIAVERKNNDFDA